MAQELSLTRSAARTLTDEVKADAAALWSKLLRLYEGEAHLVLGYSSWGAYYEAEFGGSDATAYRILQSARVIDQLPMGSSDPASERVARELAPLLDGEPETVEEVWAEVVEEHGDQPTAAQVRETVEAHLPARQQKRQGRVVEAIVARVVSMQGLLDELDLDTARSETSEERKQEWAKQLRAHRTAISQLIGALE